MPIQPFGLVERAPDVLEYRHTLAPVARKEPSMLSILLEQGMNYTYNLYIGGELIDTREYEEYPGISQVFEDFKDAISERLSQYS